MVDLIQLILLFINIFATVGILAVFVMWIYENQGIFDDPKALIRYLAPSVVVFGLMLGLGYGNLIGVIAVGITTAASALIFSLRKGP